MAYDAKVLEVMIASPSDVTHEREIVRDIVAEWNAIHSRKDGVVMLPLGWDTHSSPELGGRPQQMINDRILDHADILIGIFWTKLGTPTGVAQSGTAEEIQKHHAAGKPVLLYFSDVPIVAGNLDQDQFNALQDFKKWAYGEGLVQAFSTKEQFRDDFRRHLQLCLQHNPYITGLIDVDLVDVFNAAITVPAALSADAIHLLVMAAAPTAKNNMILLMRHLGGTGISAGGEAIVGQANQREAARWQAAVDELRDDGFVTDLNGKGQIFELTHKGFLEADRLGQATPAS